MNFGSIWVDLGHYVVEIVLVVMAELQQERVPAVNVISRRRPVVTLSVYDT